MEWQWQGTVELPGDKLSQGNLGLHKSHTKWSKTEHGSLQAEACIDVNRISEFSPTLREHLCPIYRSVTVNIV